MNDSEFQARADSLRTTIKKVQEIAEQDTLCRILDLMVEGYIEAEHTTLKQSKTMYELAQFITNPDHYNAGHKWMINGFASITGLGSLWDDELGDK